MATKKSDKDTYLAKGVGAQGLGSLGLGGSVKSANEVENDHTNADTDTRAEAIHHTLGPGPSQAAPGNHRHDGGSSSFLWDGATITGSRGGNLAIASIISLLVQKGAVDATTI